mmetsp:Transcript_107405/g.256630  ORF Transcript_107405/g.256630 Transcript_107405/m.256630 type:complete len:248 (-) Transcript_107405:886-1629(-)
MARALEVLHDPGDVAQGVLLHHVPDEDLSTVAGVRDAGLGGLLDRLDLLAQHSENHHQLGVVELLLLSELAETGCCELDHVDIDGPLKHGNVQIRQRCFLLLCFCHLCRMLAAEKLQPPGDIVYQMRHIELGANVDSLRQAPFAGAAHDAYQRAEVLSRLLHEVAVTLEDLLVVVGAIIKCSAHVRIQLVVIPHRPLSQVHKEGILEHILLLVAAQRVAELLPPQHRAALLDNVALVHGGQQAEGTI